MAPRVCIVTPGALGSNPRTVKEAGALSAAGYDVTVISTRTSEPVDALDDDVLANAAWRSVRIDLRRPFRRHGARLSQMAAAAAFGATGVAALAQSALSAFTPWLARAAQAAPADLYIAHYPPALAAAAYAAKLHGARYAYDAEDFHPGDTVSEAQNRLVRTLEAQVLPGCSYISAAAPGIADAYARAYGVARPCVLLNVFPRAEAPAGPTPAGDAAPGPSIYWISQTVGPDRGLECAVDALALARTQPHLHLRGSVSDSFRAALTRQATRAGVGERLHFLPTAPPSQMVPLAARFDVGLVSEVGHTESRRIALTNKQFIYLLAGVPAVMSAIPAHSAFAAEAPGAAFLYDTGSPASLAAALDALFEDPARLAVARARAFDLAQRRFNWDAEQAKLLELVRAALTPIMAVVDGSVGAWT